MNRRAFWWMLIGLAGASACRRIAPLSNTRQSAEALAATILAALLGRDTDRLEALALSEQEFRDHVWPDLPASRPERNLPFSYVWGDLRLKSRAGLSSIMQEHSGRVYRLDRVAFSAETDFGGYTVHRDTALYVADEEQQSRVIRVCGSMVEAGAGWKVFSYAVD